MTSTFSGTSGKEQHLEFFDGWRGLAILLLLIGHFFPIPGINLGTVGVNLFFVLSGWLMTRLLFVRQTPIDVFYRRRIARIIPAHIFFVTAITLFYVLTNRTASMSEVLAATFFVNNYVGSAPGESIMPFGHIWSLSVEEHSYILLSILALGCRRGLSRPASVLGGATLITIACAVGYSMLLPDAELLFNQWLHTEVAAYAIFASGFAFLMLRTLETERKWLTWAIPLMVLFGLSLHWWSVPLVAQRILGVGTLALALNLLPLAPPILQSAFAWKPLQYLGMWSYSLYLWQQPFYLWSHGEDGNAFIGLLCALVAGLASYYLLESPARSYLNRNWGAAKPRMIA